MRRSFAALLIGGVLLAAALLLFAQGAARQSSATPFVPPGAVASRLTPLLGVNTALQQVDASQRTSALDQIGAAGFGWVRQRFPWDEIEPAPGQFNWTPWDDIVADVAQHNLALVAVLDGSPAWARPAEDAGNPLAPPRQQADFGRFASAFARRYGDRIRFYQVWDEPNIAPHWGAQSVTPAGYAGLLREAAVQLRATDPDAVVLAAALAPNVEPGGLNQSDVDYLDDLYQAGAAPWFDGAAGQPYGFDRPPEEAPQVGVLNFRRAELLREVMRRHGDGQSPLWLAAYGWHAPLAGQPASDSPWHSVDVAKQARWAVEAAAWAERNWPWSGGMAWAWWQPPQPAPDPHWGFALVDPNGKPRPVLAALGAWNRQTRPLGPGVWPPTAAGIQAEGGWRLTNQAADPPQGAAIGNNRLLIPFDGTDLALSVQRGAYWGYLAVSIDGKPANALPKDETGRAILVLHDPLAAQEVVPVAQSLPDGQHLAEIAASGGWDQWPLLAIEVLRDDASARSPEGGAQFPLDWLALALAGAGLLALVAGGAGIAARKRPRQTWQLLAWPARTVARSQRVPPAARYAALAGLAAAVWLLPAWGQAPALGLLFLLFVAYPETGLALVAALAPLFLVLVPVLGHPFSPTELAVWLAAAALATRIVIDWLGARASVANATLNSAPSASTRPLHSTAPRVFAPPSSFLFALSALDWPVLALAAAATLSLLAAQNLGVAVREWRTVIVAGVLAYGLVRLAPSRSGIFDPWPTVWGIGLGAAIVASWGIYQAVARTGLITAEGVLRARGPYGSPNNLALYLGHALPILLAVAVFATVRSRRVAAALLSLLLFAGLVLTWSKGALLLGLPVAVLVMGFAAGGRWRWAALAAVAVGALAMLPLFRTERFAGLLDLGSGTSFFRVQLWRGAWNMVRDHPWLGVGLDNFLYAYRTRYVLPSAWQELNLSHPHNIVLDFWTRIGLAGLVVGAWLFGAAFWQGWRGLRWLQGDGRALMLGLLASLAATLAHGLIDNSVFLVDLMLLFMLSLGLTVRLTERRPGQQQDLRNAGLAEP